MYARTSLILLAILLLPGCPPTDTGDQVVNLPDKDARCYPTGLRRQMADFEVTIDPRPGNNDLLLTKNVWDRTEYSGKNEPPFDVVLFRLSGEDGVSWGGSGDPESNVLVSRLLPDGVVNDLGTDHNPGAYDGFNWANGPEFMIPPPGLPVDLGVMYGSPQGVRGVWRATGADDDDFTYDVYGDPIVDGIPQALWPPADPSETPGYYMGAAHPDGLGVYYATCEGMGYSLSGEAPPVCYTALPGVSVNGQTATLEDPGVNLVEELGALGLEGRLGDTSQQGTIAFAHHPDDPEKLAAYACTGDPTSSECGVFIGRYDPTADRTSALVAEDWSAPKISNWSTATGDAVLGAGKETLRGMVVPGAPAGETVWAFSDAEQYLKLGSWNGATSEALFEIQPNNPDDCAAPIEHVRAISNDSYTIVYFQIREAEGNCDFEVGSYGVGIRYENGAYEFAPVQSIVGVSAELVWLPDADGGAGSWASYFNGNTIDRCWVDPPAF